MTEAPGRSPAARLLGTTLDLLPVKIVITDFDGRILHTNAAAAEMLATGDPIWSRHGQLSATKSAATTALIAAITSAAAPTGRDGSEVPLPCRDGGAAIAHVRPLQIGAARLGSCLGIAVVLFITEPLRVVPPLEALARLFDLTPSEIRVLEEVVSGKNRKESAAALGLADSTVKTHLDHLYAKTGTSDQPALRRLVTSLSWPLVAGRR